MSIILLFILANIAMLTVPILILKIKDIYIDLCYATQLKTTIQMSKIKNNLIEIEHSEKLFDDDSGFNEWFKE